MTKIVASGDVKIKVVKKPKKEKDILNEVENENWSPIHLCGCSGNSPIVHLCGCTAGQTDGSDDSFVNKNKRKK